MEWRISVACDQNDKDHAAFQGAIRDGKIEAVVEIGGLGG